MAPDPLSGELRCQGCGGRANPWENPGACEGTAARVSERESWHQTRRQLTAFLLVGGGLLVAGLVVFLIGPSPRGSPARQIKDLVFGHHLTEAVERARRAPQRTASRESNRAEPPLLPPPSPGASPAAPPAGLAEAPGPSGNAGRSPGGAGPGSQPSAVEAPAEAPEDEMAPSAEAPGRASPPPRTGSRATSLAQVKSSGSGFFITTEGHLLTSLHVVAQARRIVVATKTGRFPVRVLAGDANNDVALLKASVQAIPLPLADSRAVALGETVFTIGFPVPSIQGIEPKLTDGKISSLAGAQDDPRYFQTSVAVQPGNSGGPLVNQAGNVVGIVTMRLDDLKTWKITGSLPQNVNYALKSSFITPFLQNHPEVLQNQGRPHLASGRRFEEVVREAQEGVVLVLVY